MDASNIIFDAKTNANRQNSVGVMTMAGKGPQILSNLTDDIGKILKALHITQVAGTSNLTTGINIAQLALKHRQDKTQSQRIVAFVASPIEASEEELVALGKKLKKNNVAVDLVNFGEEQINTTKLEKLIETVDSGGNSNLVTLEAGSRLLSDVILSSPILMEGGAGGGGEGGSGGQGGGDFEFGVDPSMDPELAMALRMSLEEEQARVRAAEGTSGSSQTLPPVAEGSEPSTTTAPPPPVAAAPSSSTAAAGASSSGSAAATSGPTAPQTGMPSGGSLINPTADAVAGHGSASEDQSEEELLRQAMAMSRGEGGGADEDVEMSSSGAAPTTRTTRTGGGQATVAGANGEDEEMTEEEAIARAIEMSMQGEDEQQNKQ